MSVSARRQWARRAARAILRRQRSANGPAFRTAIPTGDDAGPIDLLAAGLPDIDWAGRDVEQPSYRYKLHESKRRKLLLDVEGHRQRVWAFNDKLAGLRLATELDVATPRTIADVPVLDDLDWETLPDRFVLKPLHGAASRGTFLLCRNGDGFDDLMDGKFKSKDDVVGAAQDLTDRGLISARFCVEELLAPRADLRDRIAQPDDFKVFCFWDRPVVVMQRRLGGQLNPSAWRFKFWTSAWEDLGPVKYPDRCDPTLEAPTGGEELMEAAARIGRQLAIPFVRLDFYDTDRGVVFGEVTPHPGPPERWDPRVDEILGRHWEHAEARLLAAGVAPNEPKP